MVIEYDKIITNVLKELENPTERLISIRKQLETGLSTDGELLDTITFELEDSLVEEFNNMIEKYNTTGDEIIWLLLEEIINQNKKTTEDN